MERSLLLLGIREAKRGHRNLQLCFSTVATPPCHSAGLYDTRYDSAQLDAPIRVAIQVDSQKPSLRGESATWKHSGEGPLTRLLRNAE